MTINFFHMTCSNNASQNRKKHQNWGINHFIAWHEHFTWLRVLTGRKQLSCWLISQCGGVEKGTTVDKSKQNLIWHYKKEMPSNSKCYISKYHSESWEQTGGSHFPTYNLQEVSTDPKHWEGQCREKWNHGEESLQIRKENMLEWNPSELKKYFLKGELHFHKLTPAAMVNFKHALS